MLGRDWTAKTPLPECSACPEGAKKFVGEPCDGRCVFETKHWEAYTAKRKKVELRYRGPSHVRVHLRKFGRWDENVLINPKGDPGHVYTGPVGRGRRVVVKTNLEGFGSHLEVRNRSPEKLLVVVTQRSARRSER